MRIRKPWWLTEHSKNVFRAFSYPDNPRYPEKFARMYGGLALDSFEPPTEVLEALEDGFTELCSVLYSSPRPTLGEGPEDPNRFKVLVRIGEEWRVFDPGYRTLKESNASAKTLSRVFSKVLVVRKRNKGA